jgi:RNA polymerase sigma-70 factor, ECF subfamily
MSPDQQFLEQYDLYADGIFRFCLFKVSQRELARDLTQEVFLHAWDYIAKGKGVDNYKSFLYRIASNLVIDYYRKKKENSLDELMEAGFDPTSGDATNRMNDKVDGSKIIETLHSLEPQYRDVLVMRHVEDMAVKDIAEILGEKENNISVRIYRGLNQLRTLLPK